MSIDPNQRTFQVGDEVWIDFCGIVVRCKVTYIDDYFRQQHPDSYLFYDVDEPIGHSLGSEDLFTSREQAVTAVRNRYEANLGETYTTDLYELRESSLRFILSTHLKEDSYGKVELVESSLLEERLATYPNKQEGLDWFRREDLDSLIHGSV